MNPTEAAPAPPPRRPTLRPAAPAPAPAPPRDRRWLRRAAWAVVILALLAVGLVTLTRWVAYRRGHSITDDAFVEAHIVNVAPELVSGRIVRFLVEEDDHVERGQILAEVDSIPYRDRVDLARSKLDAAQAELARQRADLERVRKEVPIQVEIARRSLGSAEADLRPARGVARIHQG